MGRKLSEDVPVPVNRLCLGGTVAGEHEVGVTKLEHLRRHVDRRLLERRRRLKNVFDPKRLLNPGKAL